MAQTRFKIVRFPVSFAAHNIMKKRSELLASWKKKLLQATFARSHNVVSLPHRGAPASRSPFICEGTFLKRAGETGERRWEKGRQMKCWKKEEREEEKLYVDTELAVWGKKARGEEQDEDWSQRDSEQTGFVLKALQLIDRMRACLQSKAGCHVSEERRAVEERCRGLFWHRRHVRLPIFLIVHKTVNLCVSELFVCQLLDGCQRRLDIKRPWSIARITPWFSLIINNFPATSFTHAYFFFVQWKQLLCTYCSQHVFGVISDNKTFFFLKPLSNKFEYENIRLLSSGFFRPDEVKSSNV